MEGAAVWAEVNIAVAAPTGWTRAAVLGGLRELERLQRQLDAARSLLIVALGPRGRDTAAAVSRSIGVSNGVARTRARVAAVIERLPKAAKALASGQISTEHILALEAVSDSSHANELLGVAAEQSADEFRDTVTRQRIERNGDEIGERRRQARSVRFFNAPDGMTALTAVLPPVDGEELRSALTRIADARWKAAHPERAETRGGHDDEPYAARLADALMDLVRGNGGSTASVSGRPAVIVTIDAETLAADLAGSAPIPTGEAIDLAAARADVYAAIRDTKGAILNFGRSRRLASALQRLALVARDGGRCVYTGCMAHWTRCEAHHCNPAGDGGPTDLRLLALVCDPHHHHLHDNRQRLTRTPDGNWIVTDQHDRPIDTDPIDTDPIDADPIDADPIDHAA